MPDGKVRDGWRLLREAHAGVPVLCQGGVNGCEMYCGPVARHQVGHKVNLEVFPRTVNHLPLVPWQEPDDFLHHNLVIFTQRWHYNILLEEYFHLIVVY